MFTRFTSRFISVLTIVLILSYQAQADDDLNESHMKVVMRMIGHEVLLSMGDSSSRVLPVIKENNGYRINFETEFSFDPEELVSIIKRVADETELAERYLVEVQQCQSNDLVYSFEVAPLPQNSLIACKERIQPTDCYSIVITILNETQPTAAHSSNDFSSAIVLTGALGIVVAIMLLYWFKKPKQSTNCNTINIGSYSFDRQNLELIHGNVRTELTSKEAELLHILHASANETLGRDEILKEVWGDEGDYIGRTLDVFISKLRKKLEADPNIRILNVRGVGYKLVT